MAATAEPLASGFCLFTTSCCDELKLSEAVLFGGGAMVSFGEQAVEPRLLSEMRLNKGCNV